MTTPIQWITRRTYNTQTPEKCKSCDHRMSDVAEGQTCWKIDTEITLSSGAVLMWPGRACNSAWEDCQGEQFSPARFGRLSYWTGLGTPPLMRNAQS